MTTIKIENPYDIDKMGTSGLRMTQEKYNRPLFIEQFAQGLASFFKELTENNKVAKNNDTILIGGDPRKGNHERLGTIAEILTGNGFKVIIAGDGIASTPAMSHAIRTLEVAGGIILTASHNPFTDVGIKVNTANGAPALADTVDRIHFHQNSTSEYSRLNQQDATNQGLITKIDIIKMYADLLDSIFDFNSMKEKIKTKRLKAALDSMNGAAGPFAHEIFINRLELDAVMLREEPREDLGGLDEHGHPCHPEPDFDYIAELIKLNSTEKYDIVGSWDSDVDRRLNGGKGFFLESADEFALFSKYSDLIKIDTLFDDTIYFCRSTVTPDPADRMEKALKEKFPDKKVATIETPTGFKWIAELGNWGVEESNGVGNPYLREKDGIFATVFLLKILVETDKTPKQLIEAIWEEYGRVYFTRGEVSGSDMSEKDILEKILNQAPSCQGQSYGSLTLEKAECWDYIHPISGQIASKDAAYVLTFNDGNTVKARFSGTGSGGYTLRAYCSKYDKRYDLPKGEITAPMKEAFDAFLNANGFNGKSKKYSDANQPDPYIQK